MITHISGSRQQGTCWWLAGWLHKFRERSQNPAPYRNNRIWSNYHIFGRHVLHPWPGHGYPHPWISPCQAVAGAPPTGTKGVREWEKEGGGKVRMEGRGRKEVGTEGWNEGREGTEGLQLANKSGSWCTTRALPLPPLPALYCCGSRWEWLLRWHHHDAMKAGAPPSPSPWNSERTPNRPLCRKCYEGFWSPQLEYM